MPTITGLTVGLFTFEKQWLYGPFSILGTMNTKRFDITDPTNPFQVSDWGIQDIGGPFYAGQGCDADANYGHGAEPSDDGKLVFVSYWDSGFIALDLTDPTTPVFKGRTVYPANADGDAHSASYDDARQLLFSADEDFCKTSGPGIEKGQGYLRIWDYSNLAAPVQIGSFRTPNSSRTRDVAAGDYSIHNALVVGTDVYISWYSDGIRVLDASDPTSPQEVAYFVPHLPTTRSSHHSAVCSPTRQKSGAWYTTQRQGLSTPAT